jgi:NAD(P)-dependent dehydrogenase (short-subunit alcohol dehydrogenase family)
MSSDRLRDRVVIITGASRGIGKASALAFAQEGARVALVSRSREELDKVLEEIKALGGKGVVIRADITQEADVSGMVDSVATAFGKIDILVNNAGVVIYSPIISSKTEDWDTQINTNLKGTYLCSRFVLAKMLKEKQGHIINVSSVMGKHGQKLLGAYCASKFGVMGFSKVLAMETRPYNIRVSVICPGGVDTSIFDYAPYNVDRSRLLKPHQVADVILSIALAPPGQLIEEIVVTSFHPAKTKGILKSMASKLKPF